MRYINVYCNDTEELIDRYTEYLKSKHWNNLKILLENLTNNYCMKCNEKIERSYLIHKNFNRLGNEKITDIELLCGKCYKEIPKIDFKFEGEKKEKKTCFKCKYSKMMIMKHPKTKDTKELYCNLHCFSVNDKEEVCKNFKKKKLNQNKF